MSRLIVRSFTISLDGYGAGPNQSKETPLGEGGEELHEWLVGTRFLKQMGLETAVRMQRVLGANCGTNVGI